MGGGEAGREGEGGGGGEQGLDGLMEGGAGLMEC